ncbi:MAG: Brp/Blh family beta-carotene 15,15'-dioxygenase, partial [Bacteroidota bacterium]
MRQITVESTSEKASIKSGDRLQFQHYGVFRYVVGVTMAIVLLNLAFPVALTSAEPYLVIALLLLLGIPHGATDTTIFQALSKKEVDKRKMILFGFAYLAIILAYGAIWYIVPVWAFLFFLLLSVYHFGQSN